jgi:hypothetical protein
MTTDRSSAFDRYVREAVGRILAALTDYGLIDPASRELDEAAARRLLSLPPGRDGREAGYLVDAAPLLAALFEYLGEPGQAGVCYRLGMNQWPHPWPVHPNNREDDDLSLRTALSQAQLQAAVCADRAGDRQRAAVLYEWAAGHLALEPEELDEFARTKQPEPVWESFSYRAYALACLGRWDEALAAAGEAARWADLDRRASAGAAQHPPLNLVPVVQALARYATEPTEARRIEAARMLRPEALARREHSAHAWALFYLYNLRLRRPELLQPEQAPVGWGRPAAEARLLAHPEAVSALAFSPDGRTLAVGLAGGGVWLWDLLEGTASRRFEAHPNAVRSLAFSPDGARLASGANRAYGTKEPTLRLWDAGGGRLLFDLEGHSDSVIGLAFTPDGGLLFSACYDGTLRAWEPRSGRLVRQDKIDGVLNSLALSPDGRLLAGGGGGFHGRVYLWEIGGKGPSVLEDHDEAACSDESEAIVEHDITSTAFDGGGKRVAAGAMDGKLLAFGLEGERRSRLWEAHEPGLVWVAVPAGEDLVLSAGMDGKVAAWGLDDGAGLWELQLAEELSALALSPDGRWLAAGGKAGKVRLWEKEAG